MNSEIALRDFIYLDVERVKSLLAQLDQGLLLDRSESKGSSGTVGGGATLRIPLLAEIGGTGEYVATNQATETKTLHDYVYNYTEDLLLNSGKIIVLPDNFTESEFLTDQVRNSLSPVDYILARGIPQLRDMNAILDVMADYNEIMLSMARLTQSDSFKPELSKNARQKLMDEIKNAASPSLLDEQMHRDFMKVLTKFYKDRLIFRLMPFEDPNIRISGPINAAHLRDSLGDIRLKYGSNPNSNWTVFAQIASIPDQNAANASLQQEFSIAMEGALEGIFGALSNFESMLSIAYPEIAITPIAIYRE